MATKPEPALTTGKEDGARKRLTYQDILESKARTLDVEVPEWGGVVTLRELSASDRSDIENDAYRTQQDGGVFDLKVWRMKFVVLSVIDQDGKRMFDGEADVKALGDKSYAPVQRIFEAALEFNGMQATTEKVAQDFTEDQPNASSSD